MADEKKTVKKVEAPAPAETETAPLQSTGEAPQHEIVVTGYEEHVEVGVSEDEKKADLQEEARERGLDDSGTKQELVDRINEHDEQGVHKPEVLYPLEED